MITAPEKGKLKAIEARIAGLLTKIPLSASVHGGVRGKSATNECRAASRSALPW